MRVRVLETASGDLSLVEPSGKAAMARWIDSGKIRVDDWGGMVGTVSTSGITRNGNRRMWTKV
jgi:hypothetical protein